MIYDVNIEILEFFCVLDVKGERTDVSSRLAALRIAPPASPNTAAISGDMALCWVGPTQWILRAPESTEELLMQELQTTEFDGRTSVVEISDMLQFFSVRGPDADDVLSTVCPLDTHLTKFPDNATTFTEIFGTRALLLRVSDGYHFAVERSYADFINDSLHRVLGTPLAVDHAGRSPYELCG
jgi:sarcosine oxidase subunit gamma